MSAITILNKDNVPTGPFTREQVAEKLTKGECSLRDMAFMEGLSQWTTLSDVLTRIDGVALTAPVTAPPAFPSIPAAAARSTRNAPAYSSSSSVPPPVPTATSKMAIGAIVCGFLGIFMGITMIPAVVMGHLALSEIKKNPSLKGRSMAITSLVIGYIWIAIVVICVVIAVMVNCPACRPECGGFSPFHDDRSVSIPWPISRSRLFAFAQDDDNLK